MKETLRELVPDAELPHQLLEYPKSCVHTSTNFQRFVAPDSYSKGFEVEADALDRRKFDRYLVKQAAKSGADVLIGTNVTEINNSTIATDGIFGKADYSCKVLIGADGPNSLVGKSRGLVREHDPMGVGTAFEYELTGVDVDRTAVEMYFGKKYVPGGYAWIISQGEDNANIGVGVREALFEENMCARDYLNRFMQEHPQASGKLEGGTIVSVVAGLVPVGGAPSKTATKDTLIAGDAAGHIIATNGGGIATAMIGGKIAGETAVDHLNGKCNLEAYEKRWREQMGLEIKTAVYARKLMDNLMKSDTLMSKAIRVISPEQMKDIQCGKLPASVKKALLKLNFGLN